MVQHTGIKEFACDICQKRFTRKDTLKNHVFHTHMNVKLL